MAASWSKAQAVYRSRGVKLYRSRSSRLFTPSSFSSSLLANLTDHEYTTITGKHASTSGVTKKDISQEMDKTYNSSEVEAGWYDWWVQQGYFTPSGDVGSRRPDSKVFSLLLPPPNVTGNLHLGHALTGAIQDAFVRWRRMRGDQTLWVPGTDHAGIATHFVVEKKLWKEQRKTRHDLGREAFVEEVWRWKQEHGHTITQQLRRLGLSLDWSKEYFTMEERLNVAVTEAFCRLYESGLIYRDKRMVNWSSALRSSLSDIEVDSLTLEGPTTLKVPGLEEKVEFGVISQFAYPVVNSDEKIIVATTRLETMLGDTAVAVNPNDERYSHLVGQKVVHPLDKGRLLPIIADPFVDMSFGTGAVKLTPGHDSIDYEVGCRHGLPILEIFSDDGTICSHIEHFGGQNRFVARRKIREALCLLGCYLGEKKHPTVLPLCSRTGDVVEPRLKDQWFLNCKEMAQEALKAVESGQIKLLPAYNENIWYEHLKNSQSRDWCLSRQLWWGHRIPVYTCKASNRKVCARSELEAKEKLARELGLESVDVVQDEDVLDTWFSSSLLPFSLFGWPGSTQSPTAGSPPLPESGDDLSVYFPQTLMETGQDILFFWVARMAMMSLELTGQVPFKEVLLHGLIRDAQGRKMSKSLGNVIDPMDVINGASLQDLNSRLESGNLDPSEMELAKEGHRKSFPSGMPKCGADALRFTLCFYNLQNVNIIFDVSHAENKMRLCNKIWQSFKFIFSKLEPTVSIPERFQLSGSEDNTDLWILSRLSHLVQVCDTHFESRDIHLVASSLQQFWHFELCDVYLEAIKPVFISQDELRQEAVRQVLALCSHSFLFLAAPFLPFLCEELYHRVQQVCIRQGEPWPESICVAAYPQPHEYPWQNPQVESSMAQVLSVVHHVQKLRKDYQVLGKKGEICLEISSDQIRKDVLEYKTCLLALSRSSGVTVSSPDTDQSSGSPSSYVNPDLRVILNLQDSGIDFEKEIDRLEKRLNKLESKRTELSVKLDKFGAKGRGGLPQAVALRGKLMSIDGEVEKLSQMVKSLSSSR